MPGRRGRVRELEGAARARSRDAARCYRIAMVVACPFPSLRGSQVLIRELSEELARAGHAVHVVTYPTGEHLVPIREIAIHRVAKWPGLWTDRPLGWQKLVLDLLLVKKLLEVVRREGIDLVHAHNFEGPLVGYLVRALTGVPVVYHAHNALSDELPSYVGRTVCKRIAGRIGAFLDRQVGARADFSIALSDRLAAFLAVRGAAGKVEVVPPGARTCAPAPGPSPRRSDGPVLMYAGNLDAYQDVAVLVDGFRRIRERLSGARLVIVTHPAAALRRVAEGLRTEPRVELRTAGSFAAARRELHEADVVICPRGSWSGFPIKALNYMSLGRPIVHARSSAHAIEHGVTGLLFDDGDPVSLAEAVLDVLARPERAAALAAQARATVRTRYRWPAVLPKVLAIYRTVLQQAYEGLDQAGRKETLAEAAVTDRKLYGAVDERRQ